jgi:hypothetical protein
MKKVKSKLGGVINTLFVGLGIFLISSCDPDNPQPNNPGTGTAIQWNINLGGQIYSWQGTYPDNMSGGSALGATNGSVTPCSIIGTLSTGNKTLAISLPVYSTGNYTLTSSNSSPSNYIAFSENGSPNFSTQYGGSVNVNVTSFPNVVNGVISGSFSGTIGKSPTTGGGTVTISGSFDVLRSN